MADIERTATETVTKPIAFAKNNPWAFLLLALVVMLLTLHYSPKINAWLAARATKPTGPMHGVAKFAGAVTAAILFCLISGTASAATGAPIHAGWLTWAAPLGMLGAVVAFPLSDFVALKNRDDLYAPNITPTTKPVEKEFSFRSERETFNGFPLRVTDIQFAISVGLKQDGGCSAKAINWDELFRITNGLEIYSPRFGTIVDKDSATGPVWKHMMEFVSNGYAYSGDEPYASISSIVEGSAALTIYQNFPIMQRWAAKPDETAMFVGWLRETSLKYSLAAADTIGAVSPGATLGTNPVTVRAGFRYIVGAQQGKPAQSYPVPPIAYHRVLQTAASGQKDIVFDNISDSGPQNTDVTNGERLVAAVLLSSNLGLGGPGTFENVTEVGCDVLGQQPSESPDLFRLAHTPIERRAMPGQAGWPQTMEGAANSDGPCAASDLGIFFRLPSLGTKVSKLQRIAGSLTLHARQTTPPSTGQHKLYMLTLRDINSTYAASLVASVGHSGRLTRAVKGANQAVQNGTATPAQFTGIPQVVE